MIWPAGANVVAGGIVGVGLADGLMEQNDEQVGEIDDLEAQGHRYCDDMGRWCKGDETRKSQPRWKERTWKTLSGVPYSLRGRPWTK